MTVYSMTGYASVQAALGAGDGASVLMLELRSVNSRFLDLVLKVPDAFKPLEGKLRQSLAEQLQRGKVELRVALRETGAGAGALDVRALQQLHWIQTQVQNWLPDARALSVAEALQWLQSRAPQEHGLEWTPELERAVMQAIAALKHARASEGARLKAILLEKVDALREWVAKAAPLVPRLVEQQRERFLERWKEALASASDANGTPPVEEREAQQRALTEATAFAIRIDVAEELARLTAHLDEVEHLLGQGGAVGKRLDFLMQELHREANTLGSKSALLELSRISMEMKVLIEQMREQVQNIE
ncbi:YicC/YloC family endoribonuclease [Lampropedia cohaerens]|nr:YicC/YloC family endoribonuclease [Lampropedia cohaerens]